MRKAGLKEARKHARDLKRIGVAVLVFGIFAITATLFLLGFAIGVERTEAEKDLLKLMILPEVMLIAGGAATLYEAVKIDGILKEFVT